MAHDEINKLLGVEETNMNKDLQRMFENAEIEVSNPTPGAEVNVTSDTIHLSSDQFSTTETRFLAGVESSWNKMDLKRVRSCPKEELKNLKISCWRCLNKEFKDMSEAPEYSDYCCSDFVSDEINSKTFTSKSGKKEKIILGRDIQFVCPICLAKKTIALEEEE